MIVLALDTCMQACSSAVLRAAGADDALFHVSEALGRGHAEAIVPMVQRVIADARIGYDEIDRIAVTTGPGSFTGVRVGVAAARALALATGAGLVGIPSLEVIAREARERLNRADATFAVAIDARRGQVYFASYDSGGAVLRPPAALNADEAAARLPQAGVSLLIGSGAPMVAQAAAGRDVKVEIVPGAWLPDAGVLARMAAGREPASAPVEPLYLRPPDARPQADKAVARR